MILSFTQDASLYKGLNQVLDYHVSGYHSVPMPDYDKTYYYFDEKARQIVACRILKVVVGNLSNRTQNFFLIKTPNGTREVQEDKYKFFASALDYDTILLITDGWGENEVFLGECLGLTEETCPRCGAPLYVSDLCRFKYVCLECDENFD